MIFIPQTKWSNCGECVLMNLAHNYKTTNLYLKTTKNMTISTLSTLISINLVDNSILFCSDFSIFSLKVFPVVLHLDYMFFKHYLIIWEVKDGKCLVTDPSSEGIKWIKSKKIEKYWSGYFIELYGYKRKIVEFEPYISYSVRTMMRFFFIISLLSLLFLK